MRAIATALSGLPSAPGSVCIHTHVNTDIHLHRHTHTHRHTHRHKQTHTHTHTQRHSHSDTAVPLQTQSKHSSSEWVWSLRWNLKDLRVAENVLHPTITNSLFTWIGLDYSWISIIQSKLLQNVHNLKNKMRLSQNAVLKWHSGSGWGWGIQRVHKLLGNFSNLQLLHKQLSLPR